MKTFVSALTLGLLVAFSAPAFAGSRTLQRRLNRATQLSSKTRQPSSKRRRSMY